MSSSKFLTLQTSDGEVFELDEAVAVRSQVIKNMVLEAVDCASNAIPLPSVDGKTMTKVIEYWKKHSEVGVSEDQLQNFDKDFLKVNNVVLCDLLLAAKYLGDTELVDVICQEIANRMKGKPPEKIREEFNIKNDYTPEEEEEVRKENAWAFD